MMTIDIPPDVFHVAAAAQQKGKAFRYALNCVHITRAEGFATATAADGRIALRAKWADAGEPLEFLVEIADWRELTKLARSAPVRLTPEFNMLNAAASQPLVNGYLLATLARAVHYLTDGGQVTMSWADGSPLLLKASGNDLDVTGVLMTIAAKSQQAA